MKPAKHLKIAGTDECSPNCFPCKLTTVSFAPSAMDTRFPQAARAAIKDPELDKDREAYKRLRRDGEQPKHIGGSAYFEAKANSSYEISPGRIEPDTSIRKQTAREFAGMPAPSSSPIVRDQ